MARPKPDDDDGAPLLFFLMAMLLCAVVPWSLVVLWSFLFPGKRELQRSFPSETEGGLKVRDCQTEAMARIRVKKMQELSSRGRMLTRGFLFRTFLLMLLWCWLIYICMQVRQVLSTSALYQNFDPYSILEVARSSSIGDIKKAYRKMSLKHHPDKIGRTVGQAGHQTDKFILIRKAYDALTDPVAKRNYEMYGNPDGPTKFAIGVAIPDVGKENQQLVLVLFLLLFILGVPLTLWWCMTGSGDEVCPNGVRRSTMENLGQKIRDLTGLRQTVDFLLENCESAVRPGEEAALAQLAEALGCPLTPGKGAGAIEPSVRKAQLLFHAHTQRRSDLLCPPLDADCITLVGQWRLVALAMAEISRRKCMGGQLKAALELHRCVVQALDPKQSSSSSSSGLLQVPHFTPEHIKAWRKGPRKALGLPGLLRLPGEELAASLTGLGPELELAGGTQADVCEFAASAPRVTLQEVKIGLEADQAEEDDEAAKEEDNVIYQGDYATLSLNFVRENLREGEAVGAAHTPLIENAEVPEAWWVLLEIPGGKGGRITTSWRVLDPGREVAVRVQFPVQTVGKCRCKALLLSECYAGLDLEQDVSFESKKRPKQYKQAAEQGDADEDGTEESGSGDWEED